MDRGPTSRMPLEVVDHDPAWSGWFDRLREMIWPSVSAFALGLEHVGSTSVPGLAAKPIIDMDIVLRRSDDVARCIGALRAIGYAHRGDLGIIGREMFVPTQQPYSGAQLPAHHLYACVEGSAALRNHRAIRDLLRSDAAAMEAYAALKRRLAAEFSSRGEAGRLAYGEAKTAFLVGLLRSSGVLSEAELGTIERQNAR